MVVQVAQAKIEGAMAAIHTARGTVSQKWRHFKLTMSYA